jgi:hypothetical protein
MVFFHKFSLPENDQTLLYSKFTLPLVNILSKRNNFMANYKKWTSSEIDYVKNNHELLCDEVLAVKLSQMTGQNISTAMVRRQRRKLELKKPRGRPRKNGVSVTSEPSIES